MKILSIALLLMLVQACSMTDSSVTSVLVLQSDSDAPGALCEGFSLSNQQATEFFKKSREINIKELHDKFKQLPCFVRGTLTRGNQQCSFTIQAGGTAELMCDDQTGYIVGCDLCDHLLSLRDAD